MSRAPLFSGTPTKIVQPHTIKGIYDMVLLAGIQCSCMSLMSVCQNSFILVTTWDGTDLDMTLENGDQLFKSLNKYRLLGVDYLPRTVNIYGHSVDIF